MSDLRWGNRVVDAVVNGHPGRLYEHRPRAMAELLIDAQRWAPREFIVQGNRRLTGAQHARAAGHAATRLRALGVRPRDAVVLLGFNSVEWLVAFWALQLSGANAILFNAWWSDSETEAALTLVQPRLIITDRAAERLAGNTKLLGMAELRRVVEESLARAGMAELEPSPVEEEWPALVLFSSGTTGAARGVVMSHRSVIANIQNLLLVTGRLPSDLSANHPGTVGLLTMPLFHLAGIQVALMNMLTGGKLAFLEGKFDALETLRLIEAERVRSWGSVPTMVHRVVEQPELGRFDTSSVASVQMGGAAVPEALREAVQRAFPNTRKRVGSLYGLTEAGGVLAAGSGKDIEGRPSCVGRPLPAVEIAIRDPDAGGVGEIAARAPSAPTGYLGDPTPIADEAGWVLTGDLGRLTDGFLFVVGRSKDTIIRGGENVASVHVESVLRRHPDVLDVAVVALPDRDLGEAVAAAVVVRPGAVTTETELQAFAAGRLSRFEVPSRWWLRHDTLPTNASGKTVKRDIVAAWPGQ